MTYREQAINWANEQIANNTINGPIKINAWEIIEHPLLFLTTNVERLKHASPIEQRVAYQRIRNLKQKLNEAAK